MRKGLFIVIEGANGTGKSTICETLADSLERDNVNVYRTKEPTSSEIGRLIKKWENYIRFPYSLACLIAADRYYHIQNEIEPALDDGYYVICDRYLPSSLVFQRIDGLSIKFILSLNSDIILSDMTFILDVSSEILQQRLQKRPKLTRFESLNIEKIEKEIKYYKESIKILQELGYPTHIINNEKKEIYEVISEIKTSLGEIINKLEE